jgi:hypothetical protein
LVALAVKVTGVPEHTVVAGVLIVTDGEVLALMVMVTALLVAVVVVAQATLLVSTQVTTSPLANVVLL